jgi:NAD(P)-dependent dehydrogenase (short-subunit alcohol dehydrogenase family)
VRRAVGTASLPRALDGKEIVIAGAGSPVADAIANHLRANGAHVSQPAVAADVAPCPDAVITIADHRGGAVDGDEFEQATDAIRRDFFRPVELLLAVLPAMRRAGSGQVVHLFLREAEEEMRTPADCGARAALESFSRCVAPEVLGEGIDFTTVRLSDPARAPAAVARALVHKPKRV